MAVTVLGGLVTTLALTVFVAPALYLRWGFVAEPDTSADDLFTVASASVTSTGA